MKLLVTDYDGTLFINELDLKNNINYLNMWKKLGNKIMISTGRSYPSIKNQVDIYNIPYDYLSCADGSIIYDKDGNILEMFIMDSKIIKDFQKFYNNLNYEEIQFVYPTGYSNKLINITNILGINICISTQNYTKEIVDSFILMSKDYPDYSFLNYMHPNFSYLCVKPNGINKSSTINYLKNNLGINDNNIYVIGDSDNDYEMIKNYGGVAMNTSCQSVLNIATRVYSSVSEYIEEIID